MAEADSNGTTVIDSDADTGFDFAADLATDAHAESSTADSTPSRDAGTPTSTRAQSISVRQHLNHCPNHTGKPKNGQRTVSANCRG